MIATWPPLHNSQWCEGLQVAPFVTDYLYTLDTYLTQEVCLKQI